MEFEKTFGLVSRIAAVAQGKKLPSLVAELTPGGKSLLIGTVGADEQGHPRLLLLDLPAAEAEAFGKRVLELAA